MDHDEVLALFDRRMRREAVPDGPDTRVERVGGVVRSVGPAHAWNGVLWSDLTPATADGAVAEQAAFYAGRGLTCEWKLYSHDRPDDLGRRLAAAGFEAEPAESLMVADLATLPTDAEPPAGVHLRTVAAPADVALVAEVHEQAFGTDSPWLTALLLEQLERGATDTAAVLAMAGERPVSAARLEMPAGAPFASLWSGGTVGEWRGRGIYRSLVAHRARIARERGYAYLQVDATEASRPILERLGFARLATTTPYVKAAR
ncbi:GNAT family N-acetyltransferase [Streptomyces sp. NPDC060194]|uniref:GNAT family N-acetyltransferase n=1 Tax=Streptomyces sp. NPDC060194 TaxID=3347069 RepID=UPI00365EB9E2